MINCNYKVKITDIQNKYKLDDSVINLMKQVKLMKFIWMEKK